MSRLALGTANFSQAYGVANEVGKLNKSELYNILTLVRKFNINVIDTAQAYGETEVLLGSQNLEQLNVVTKIGINSNFSHCREDIQQLVEDSCHRLRINKLYAVMLHRPEMLISSEGREIFNALQTLKKEDKVLKIGVSIYSPLILDEIMDKFDIDIVQVPFNLFDNRMETTGWSERLVERQVEIHARSVFLQGLLLMSKEKLPRFFMQKWPRIFKEWYSFLDKSRVDAKHIALKFALSRHWIDKVVVGIDSSFQLEELLGIENCIGQYDVPQFSVVDEDLIDPSRWKIS